MMQYPRLRATIQKFLLQRPFQEEFFERFPSYKEAAYADINLPVPDLPADIIQIEQRDNFNEALKHYSFDDLFDDSFGGVFGHTTPLGDKIIAQKVADELSKIIAKTPRFQSLLK